MLEWMFIGLIGVLTLLNSVLILKISRQLG